jgi:hypothetical protein
LTLFAQPTVFEICTLYNKLEDIKFDKFIVEESGKLKISFPNSSSWLHGIPDLLAIETDKNIGIYVETTEITNINKFYYVFNRDGKNYQQFIYPSIIDASFFSLLSEQNGQVSFTTHDNENYRGILDYVVRPAKSLSGELEVTEIPDKNNDGINDLIIVFPAPLNVEQILYISK